MIVYVCSPYRGEPPYSEEQRKANLTKAATYCQEVTDAGHIPICPHLYFSSFLGDTSPRERIQGMNMGKDLLDICAEVWVFGERISDGMKNEIELAKIYNKPVVYR